MNKSKISSILFGTIKRWFIYDRENHMFLTAAGHMENYKRILHNMNETERDKQRYMLLFSVRGKLPKDKRGIMIEGRKFYTREFALAEKEKENINLKQADRSRVGTVKSI